MKKTWKRLGKRLGNRLWKRLGKRVGNKLRKKTWKELEDLEKH